MSTDDKLFDRLNMAKRADLLALLGDLKLDSDEYRKYENDRLIDIVSRELRSAAGNSIANTIRGPHDLPYKQILIDVADKLCPGRFSQTEFQLSDLNTSEDIESYIYGRIGEIWSKHLDSLDASDRAKLQLQFEKDLREGGLPSQIATGVASTLMTGALGGALVAQAVATAVFASLWTTLFGVTTAQMIAGGLLGGGPIGLIIAGVAVASGPSYRKTIPCVVRLIFIKLSYEAEKNL